MKRVFLLCLLVLSSHNVHARTLNVSYDQWCPYSCLDESGNAPDGKSPGYYAEVVRAIFEPLGHEVKFHVRPWERALQETRRGALDAALSPSRSEAPYLVFPDEEIGILGWCFYTLRGSDWSYRGVASLKSQTLGVLGGNNFGDEVTAYVKRHKLDMKFVQEISGVNFMSKNVNKLLAGRISAMLEEPAATEYYLYRHGQGAMVRKAGCLEPSEMYMAFSPAIGDGKKLAREFSRGMRRLRESGELDAILSAYGLKDWR